MITWKNTPLNRRQAHVVASFTDELLDTGDGSGTGVPSPAVVWKWSSVTASHECLCNLNEVGLIETSGDGWRTTPALWRVIIDRSEARIESLAAFNGTGSVPDPE